MQLGKLYTITSLSPKKRIAYLKQAKQLNPENPEPYKYLGIVYLDAFYQFESAVKEIEAYVKQNPAGCIWPQLPGLPALLFEKLLQRT